MTRDISQNFIYVSDKFDKEKQFWLDKLSGELVRSHFPHDYTRRRISQEEYARDKIEMHIPGELSLKLLQLASRSDYNLYMVLLAVLNVLLHKYTGNEDILVTAPIYKQRVEGEFLNTVLIMRNPVSDMMTFKELLMQVKNCVMEANKHSNYPIKKLLFNLDISSFDSSSLLFETVILMENIHEPGYIEDVSPNVLFSFRRTGDSIEGHLEYNVSLYKKDTVERIAGCYIHLLGELVADMNVTLRKVDWLLPEERHLLLEVFNNTGAEYPAEKTVARLFEEQARKTPDSIAVCTTIQDLENAVPVQEFQLTYGALNEKSNRLARHLRKLGVKPGTLVGLLMGPSSWVIVSIMGVLKAGGAFLPIDNDAPQYKILSIIDESGISLLITETGEIKKHTYMFLQGLYTSRRSVRMNARRPPISDLDRLPFPDRSLVNYEKYNKYIGHAMVNSSITMQVSRGCPYNCAYCHKIWPEKHVSRSAESILEEVKVYYDIGIRRFAFIDDIFNLDVKNSRKFFQLVIKNGMDAKFFFPNGIRGDLLTRDYIDLMIEAGTINLALGLETASPRLQKLIQRNLNIEKLWENAEYFCKKYPHVILELFTMHGFPTETEEEAMETLEFIKSLKWVHFPYINILNIYPNTDMEKLALENGITRESLIKSEGLAHHELPDTLPFDKRFSLRYQTEFLNDYFLLKERLLHVLPQQIKVLKEEELAQKYNSYIPANVGSFSDLLEIVGIEEDELEGNKVFYEDSPPVPDINEMMRRHSPGREPPGKALKILLLDLSQSFSSEGHRLNDRVEPPLGLIYLLTYLNRHLGDKIKGRIYKSLIDFDSYEELKGLLAEFKPDIIGVRSLIFYREFFHQAISLIRNWGYGVPIIAGGPYATSSHDTMLQDRNIDLAVLGEGEVTFVELIKKIIENGGELPGDEFLQEIKGIAFVPGSPAAVEKTARDLIILDELELSEKPGDDLEPVTQPADLAYTIFTSGSTGKPKGVLLKNQNLVNYTGWFSRAAGLTAHDRGLLTSSFAFDLGYTPVFSSLLGGLQLHILPKEVFLYPERILNYIIQRKITYIKMTPSLFSTIVNSPYVSPGYLETLRIIVLGGEEIQVEDAEKVHAMAPGIRIMNHYGPTEATIGCIACVIDFDTFETYKAAPVIGRPISNMRAYILDKQLRLLPLNVPGQLCISGAGVGRGYLDNEEMNREKFRPNPFLEGETLYLTGDLARWLPDGNIQFLGRIDNQVKIRGYRVELGEIENTLMAHSQVKETIVMAREDQKGTKYLCAYVAPDSLDLKKLRDYLLERLPDCMIPAYFIPVDRMPLTPNGKIDRKKLPEPELGAGQDYAPPETDMEKKLADIWSEVLAVEKNIVGIDSDFFELGGNSLKAVTLVSRIHKGLNVKMKLREIFVKPTIRQLAPGLETSVEDEFITIDPVEEKEYYPLSSAQKRMYILQQMDVNSVTYNVPRIFPLQGPLHRKRLEANFKKLIDRHESLRTSFEIAAGEIVQRVHQTVDFQMEYYNVGSGDGGQDRQALSTEIHRIVKDFVRPFDLSQAPLLRVGLILTDEKQHSFILRVDMHHIISDGVSAGLYIRDFLSLSTDRELPPLRLQYKDYAQWQNKDEQQRAIKRQEAYWLNELAGELPVLNLPIDYPRPAVPSSEGASYDFVIGKELTGALHEVAREEETTFYMVMAAIYIVMLAKITGQEDIIIGTVASGRQHADLERVIGMFVNTVVLRNFPKKEKTFSEFLKSVKQRTLEAFDNQDYQFEDLVEKVVKNRDVGRNPLFDVLFELIDVNLNPEIETLPQEQAGEAENPEPGERTSKFDLTLSVIDRKETLLVSFEYCKKLFKIDTIHRFAGYFKELASSVTRDTHIRIADIEIISEEEEQRLLAAAGENVGIEAVKEDSEKDGADHMKADFDF